MICPSEPMSIEARLRGLAIIADLQQRVIEDLGRMCESTSATIARLERRIDELGGTAQPTSTRVHCLHCGDTQRLSHDIPCPCTRSYQ